MKVTTNSCEGKCHALQSELNEKQKLIDDNNERSELMQMFHEISIAETVVVANEQTVKINELLEMFKRSDAKFTAENAKFTAENAEMKNQLKENNDKFLKQDAENAEVKKQLKITEDNCVELKRHCTIFEDSVRTLIHDTPSLHHIYRRKLIFAGRDKALLRLNIHCDNDSNAAWESLNSFSTTDLSENLSLSIQGVNALKSSRAVANAIAHEYQYDKQIAEIALAVTTAIDNRDGWLNLFSFVFEQDATDIVFNQSP
jgi:hypothetical protein